MLSLSVVLIQFRSVYGFPLCLIGAILRPCNGTARRRAFVQGDTPEEREEGGGVKSQNLKRCVCVRGWVERGDAQPQA